MAWRSTDEVGGELGDIPQLIKVMKNKMLLVPPNQVAALKAMIAESSPGSELRAAISSVLRTSAATTSLASQLWHSLTSSAKVTIQRMSVIVSTRLW
jgi:hypothetical protein